MPDYDAINRIISFAVNGVEPDLCSGFGRPGGSPKERAHGRGAGERFDNQTRVPRTCPGWLFVGSTAARLAGSICYRIARQISDKIWAGVRQFSPAQVVPMRPRPWRILSKPNKHQRWSRL